MAEDSKEKTSSENVEKNKNDCNSKSVVDDVIVDLYKDVAIPIQFERCTAIDSKIPEDKSKSYARSKNNIKVYMYQMGDEGGGGSPIPDDQRRPFVINVFFWLTVSLLFTTVVATIMRIYCSTEFAKSPAGMALIICGFALYFVGFYAFMCSSCVTDSLGISSIFLFIAVSGMSIIVGFTILFKNLSVILYAAGGTLMIVFVCLFLATLNFDFTKYYAYIVVAMFALIICSVLLTIIKLVTKENFKTLTLVILCISLVVYSLNLVMELQMILGGHTIEMSPDNFFFGAFILYNSIILIFLKLLRLLQLLEVGED